jgi:hypothetical protein
MSLGAGLTVFLLCAWPAARLAAQCPDGTPPPCRAAARASAPAATSVAVLYFDNLSRDTADAYVADGLTEELITRLGQIERLQVKSRTAVQRYRGRAVEDAVVVPARSLPGTAARRAALPAAAGRRAFAVGLAMSRPGRSRRGPNRAITIP